VIVTVNRDHEYPVVFQAPPVSILLLEILLHAIQYSDGAF
jgi:hypothetical protein